MTGDAPFDLRAPTGSVRLSRGGSTRVTLSLARKGYAGPINVELRNLPARVTASSAVIPEGQDAVVAAGARAAVGSRSDVRAEGRGASAGEAQATSPAFTVSAQAAAHHKGTTPHPKAAPKQKPATRPKPK